MVKGTTRVSRAYILVGVEDQLGRCREVERCIVGLGIQCIMFW